MTKEMAIDIPPKLTAVFNGSARYRCAYGGRGSGKTRTFALMLAVNAFNAARVGKKGVILCAREFMNSLEDSSMQENRQYKASVGLILFLILVKDTSVPKTNEFLLSSVD